MLGDGGVFVVGEVGLARSAFAALAHDLVHEAVLEVLPQHQLANTFYHSQQRVQVNKKVDETLEKLFVEIQDAVLGFDS